MNNRKIIQHTSLPYLQEIFWEEFTTMITREKSSEYIFIGLSGGSSLDIFYEKIREEFHALESSIREKIFFVFLDERIVPSSDPEKNEKQLREKFLDFLISQSLIRGSQILSVPIEAENPAGSYSLRVPHIDIALFGVGPDGHIASLFPHHPLLESQERGFLEITDSPKLPLHRITVSPHMISEMKYVFLSFRKGKEEAYAKFLDEDVSIEDCPAKCISYTNSIILTDIES